MKQNRYNRRGFTLAEAMMAMVILAVAATGVLLPFSSAATVHVEAERRTIAVHLAADLLEEISATDYDSIIDTWGTFKEDKGDIAKAGRTQKYGDTIYEKYSRVVSCQEASTGEGSDAIELGIYVTVTVKFDDAEMASIGTLISR